ncbi:MAG: Lrp/AsnC family transcriptional regulator [Candidatus Hodarchaeota archaeon]
MPRKVIDDIDKRILAILSRNGRISFRKIAERIKVSESTVRKRVERLQKFGVIKSFTITIDPSVLHKGVAAFITIRPRFQDKNAVVMDLMDAEEVTELYVLNVQCGYIAKIEVESLEILHSFVEKLRENDSIESFEPCIVLRTSKQQAFQFGKNMLKELGVGEELADD